LGSKTTYKAAEEMNGVAISNNHAPFLQSSLPNVSMNKLPFIAL